MFFSDFYLHNNTFKLHFFQFHNYLHIFKVCKQLRPQTTSMPSPKFKRQQTTTKEEKKKLKTNTHQTMLPYKNEN